LCITEDRGIYNVAKSLAKCLVAYFVIDKRYAFHYLTGSNATGETIYKEYFWFAHKRGRTRRVPVTHVVVRSNRDLNDLSLSVRGPQKFAYLTLWTLGREVLLAGCTKLSAVQIVLVRVPCRDGRWLANEEQDLSDNVEVWPSPPPKARSIKYDDHALNIF